jgi:hypothetical protein
MIPPLHHHHHLVHHHHLTSGQNSALGVAVLFAFALVAYLLFFKKKGG